MEVEIPVEGIQYNEDEYRGNSQIHTFIKQVKRTLLGGFHIETDINVWILNDGIQFDCYFNDTIRPQNDCTYVFDGFILLVEVSDLIGQQNSIDIVSISKRFPKYDEKWIHTFQLDDYSHTYSCSEKIIKFLRSRNFLQTVNRKVEIITYSNNKTLVDNGLAFLVLSFVALFTEPNVKLSIKNIYGYCVGRDPRFLMYKKEKVENFK